LAAKRPEPASTASTSGDRVDDLVTSLLTASRVLVGVSARSLDGLENGDVTIPQFRTLVVLESHGEVHLNRLAEILDVNASSAMRMVDRLLAAGLVTRRENPENRRHVLIGLTDAGKAAVRRVTARRRREIKKIVARMNARDAAGLVRALGAFSDAAQEPYADDDEVTALGW
jgi:DNA-binding MarR family transcriptional regulator